MIKVLVVDDSAFMRKVISDMISAEPGFEVAGTARNGQEALEKIKQLNPDVVTLDVEMPVLDGISTLERIMETGPLPVIMLSSVTQRGADATLLALQKGAIDFVPKPSGNISLDIHTVRDEIIEKLKMASKAKIAKTPNEAVAKSKPQTFLIEKGAFKQPFYDRKTVQVADNTSVHLPRPESGKLNKLVLIGTSTGGPKALYEVIPKLPKNLPAGVLIVQHMPSGFTKSLAERLNAASELHVKEAQNDEEVMPGTVYIAPGDYHMKVRVVEKAGVGKQLFIKLTQEPSVGGHRPCVDVMMASVAEKYWSHMVGVILTGMGSDGTKGIQMIKGRMGKTIAEDASTCVVFGMPKVAIESGAIDKIAPLNEVASEIVRLL